MYFFILFCVCDIPQIASSCDEWRESFIKALGEDGQRYLKFNKNVGFC